MEIAPSIINILHLLINFLLVTSILDANSPGHRNPGAGEEIRLLELLNIKPCYFNVVLDPFGYFYPGLHIPA
jgi:hypothetical protein